MLGAHGTPAAQLAPPAMLVPLSITLMHLSITLIVLAV
jgi:hypothetical protein